MVVVGDALLDRDVEGTVERLSPDAPVPVVDHPIERVRPGGAALAAALAAADGRQVVLVTALADDAPGRELAAALGAVGVRVVNVGLSGGTPEKVRIRAGGRSLLRIDRGGPPGTVGPPTGAATDALAEAATVLVADYGRGMTAQPAFRHALESLVTGTPLVWDPHPRGVEPVPGAWIVTPNRREAEHFAPASPGDGVPAVAQRARALVSRWRARSVAVTMGEQGALLATGDGSPLLVPAPRAALSDTCGAGDRFSATCAELLADGALLSEAVEGAVAAASAFVAAGAAGALRLPAPGDGAAGDDGVHHDRSTAGDVVAEVRRRRGTVVATGGCFDILHAGHVALLEGARALGDCLVVCLNSDASVRRLKGPHRPFVGQADRAALLSALACVDAVVTFDEDTPEAVLERIRPDIFVKGGDYGGAELPEARVLERWGGQAVVLPYVEGRSSSGLAREVARRATR